MKEIVGIQFKNAGRVYYFAPLNFQFKVGDYAIVETVRGLELGKVIIANRMVEDEEVEYELKPVIRKASEYDIKLDAHHQELAKESFVVFKSSVSNLNLPMKPLYCEYTIDGQKVIFYYSADDRVDFRELLKILTPKFHLRIELRQIGPREAARIVGGVGPCGRVVCCKSCLNSFDFVTMKMAKDQNMSLNTNKISGICGKLMCCIAFEHEIYLETKKEMPSVGEMVETPSCPCCKVVGIDMVKKEVQTQEKENALPVKHKACDVKKVRVSNPNQKDAINIDSNNQDIKQTSKEKKDKQNFNSKQQKKNQTGNKEKNENK